MSKIDSKFENNLIYYLIYGIAIFIFFQFEIKVFGLYFTLNIADVFAICALALGVLKVFVQRNRFQYSIFNSTAFLIGSSAIFLISLIIGWFKFGWTSWAIMKFLGYLVLLGYLMISSLFIQVFNLSKAKPIFNMMRFTVATIILVKFIAFLIIGTKIYSYSLITSGNVYWAGFSLNRNAFAFQILLLLVLSYSVFNFEYLHKKSQMFLMGILLLGLYYTSSRTAYIAIAFIFPTYWWLKRFSLGYLLALLFISLILIFGTPFVFMLGKNLLSGLGPKGIAISNINLEISLPEGDAYRYYTLIEGFKLWLDYPIFGSGLGGFVRKMHLLHKETMVIHNTWLWLLAEFGLVGFSLFCIYGIRICKFSYSKIKIFVDTKQMESSTRLLIGTVVTFLIFSTVHDVFYQRLFWLIMGFAITQPSKKNQL